MDVVLLPLPENREAKGLRIVMGNVDAGRQGPGVDEDTIRSYLPRYRREGRRCGRTATLQ
jgi:hypothetical protein